jgi:hypothetical protein
MNLFNPFVQNVDNTTLAKRSRSAPKKFADEEEPYNEKVVARTLVGGQGSPTSDMEDQDKTTRKQQISCHQCKSTKSPTQLMFCTTIRVGKRRRCRKKFCDACLKRSHKQSLLKPNCALDKWACPSCLGSCMCANCVRDRQKNGAPVIASQQQQHEQTERDQMKREQREQRLKKTSESHQPIKITTEWLDSGSNDGDDGESGSNYGGKQRQHRQPRETQPLHQPQREDVAHLCHGQSDVQHEHAGLQHSHDDVMMM